MRTRVLLLALITAGQSCAFGSGHGPVFGFATPVNSKGEWSFDSGFFARIASFGSQSTVRSMLTYGITPQLQTSFVAPVLIQQGSLPMSATLGGGEFQGNVAWRFHHQPNAVGRRFESTVSVGVVAPGPQDSFGMFQGIHSAPGLNAWAATGVASRSSYVWLGGGVMAFGSRDGDRRPTVVTTSFVYGYRPRAWRSDQRRWDWRLFVETTGEHAGQLQRAGLLMPGTDANQVFIGPTVLGICNAFGISGGAQFPIYRDVGNVYPKERMRVAVNISYFLFSHSRSH